jgi:hypothetical protein
MAAAADPYAAFADPAPVSASTAPTPPAGDPYAAIADPAPANSVQLGDSPGSGFLNPFAGVGDTALTLGSGFLKSVNSAANDLLPDWGGTRAQLQGEIDTDPVLNYQPQTAEGKAVIGALGTITKPISNAAGWVKQQIASRAGQRAADVTGDIATLAGTRLGSEAGGAVISKLGAAKGSAAAADTAAPTSAAAQAGAGETTAFAPPSAEGANQAAVSSAEQAARAQTLRDVGLSEARDSAVTGDTKATGADFQISKLEGPPGDRMSDVIDAERAALQKYASQLTENAGGAADNDYARGATIVEPIEQLRDHYDTQTKQLYATADAAAQGAPLSLPTTGQVLGQRSAFLGTVEGKQLREGVMARMRDLGLMDEDGAMQGATVQQAEQLKQYLGDQWSPRTSRLISQLKDAIDDDVAQAAGSNVYAAARAMRSQRAAILDDPTGIAKLAQPDDRLGINRQVPLEKVPDYVTGLPVDQFQHVVRTLGTVGGDNAALGESATAALNEIRTHFASKVQAAGNSTQSMWNAKAVNQYLRANELRMREVFTSDEMRQFKTLNDGGNILRMDRTYPGAEAQRRNLATTLAASAMEHGATAAGGAVGAGLFGEPVAGAAVGRGIGEKLAGNIKQRASLKAVEKRIRRLTP